MHPNPVIVQEIETEWRRLLGGSSKNGLEKSLAFEMDSVELHRKNLVPFLRGHGVRAGKTLLDFGSGPGASATAIAYDLGAKVTGVEPNDANKTIAPRWTRAYEVADKVDFHFIDDTLHLPFEDESFDYVMASSSLEYIKNDRAPYVREMVRVLKTGGRLLVAGTSNAAWPREVHSGTWTLNWMPNLGPKVRKWLGKSPDAERGVTFGDILSADPALRFVKGTSDELFSFAARLTEPVESIPIIGEFSVVAAFRALDAIDRVAIGAVDWPMEAFLPWLNVGFEKVAIDGPVPTSP